VTRAYLLWSLALIKQWSSRTTRTPCGMICWKFADCQHCSENERDKSTQFSHREFLFEVDKYHNIFSLLVFSRDYYWLRIEIRSYVNIAQPYFVWLTELLCYPVPKHCAGAISVWFAAWRLVSRMADGGDHFFLNADKHRGEVFVLAQACCSKQGWIGWCRTQSMNRLRADFTSVFIALFAVDTQHQSWFTHPSRYHKQLGTILWRA